MVRELTLLGDSLKQTVSMSTATTPELTPHLEAVYTKVKEE